MHFGVCVATCSSGKAQHCREMTLSPSAFCLCFPEMFSLHWEEEVAVSVHLSVNLTVFLYTRCYYDSCKKEKKNISVNGVLKQNP